jgi:hypothetical protein
LPSSLALAAAYPAWGGFQPALGSFPTGAREYLTTAYAGEKYHIAGVRFLEADGARFYRASRGRVGPAPFARLSASVNALPLLDS